MEADLGYPGGKAKIIHKESDIIMAFAVNKVYIFLYWTTLFISVLKVFGLSIMKCLAFFFTGQ